MKHCGNCKHGFPAKPNDKCEECHYYNEETFNDNWEPKE